MITLSARLRYYYWTLRSMIAVGADIWCLTTCAVGPVTFFDHLSGSMVTFCAQFSLVSIITLCRSTLTTFDHWALFIFMLLAPDSDSSF